MARPRRLHDRVQHLTTELARLRGQDATAAQVHLEFLKELRAQRERALFGDSSEKRPGSEINARGGYRTAHPGAWSRTEAAESRSERGTEVAGLFYSLIESAKLCGLEPKHYLRTATCAALVDRTASTLPRVLLGSS